MKITRPHTPGATLPEDRTGPVIFDGAGTLIITRNQYGIELTGMGEQPLVIANFYVWFAVGQTRLLRFMRVIGAVWRFCK